MGWNWKETFKWADPIMGALVFPDEPDLGNASQDAFNREQIRLKEKKKTESEQARRSTQAGKGMSRTAKFSFGNEDVADTYAEKGEFGQKSFRFANNLNEGIYKDKFKDNPNHPDSFTNRALKLSAHLNVSGSQFLESIESLRKSRESDKNKTDTGLFL